MLSLKILSKLIFQNAETDTDSNDTETITEQLIEL